MGAAGAAGAMAGGAEAAEGVEGADSGVVLRGARTGMADEVSREGVEAAEEEAGATAVALAESVVFRAAAGAAKEGGDGTFLVLSDTAGAVLS